MSRKHRRAKGSSSNETTSSDSASSGADPNGPGTETAVGVSIAQRHMLVGWLGLAVFASLGLALELLHGLKIDFYLDVRNETRRLMWTLAHTHGTLFSFAHIAVALTIRAIVVTDTRSLRLASSALFAAIALMPVGFFLGGIGIHGGDPGLGILLAPLGGGAFIAAAVGMALAVRSAQSPRVDGHE